MKKSFFEVGDIVNRSCLYRQIVKIEVSLVGKKQKIICFYINNDIDDESLKNLIPIRFSKTNPWHYCTEATLRGWGKKE